MATSIDIVDLTTESSFADFSDDEDRAAFGYNPALQRLFRYKIWKLKHNDPNVAILNLQGNNMPHTVCERIGIYLWSSKYIKNLQLDSCSLSYSKIKHLFGKIAQQNITNEYVLKRDLLGDIGITEKTLVGSIMDSLTSFSNLNTVNLSCNDIGIGGLDVLVDGLCGSPIEILNISSCGIDSGFYPLEKLGMRCKRLIELDLGNNTLGASTWVISMLLNNNVYPSLRTLGLNSMGINDDIIERFSSSLRDNRSVRYLHMCNRSYKAGGSDNVIGSRGVAALCTAVHDTSSFENTLASNHIVWKISVDGIISNVLSNTTVLNYGSPGSTRNDDRTRYKIAWEKHIRYFGKNDNADMTPFMEFDIELLPHLLARIRQPRYCNQDLVLTALYKIFSCKMFIERLESAAIIRKLKDKNSQLITKISHLESAQVQDKKKQENLEESNTVLMTENKKLREQIAKLTIDNVSVSVKHQENDTTWSGSIAERVKRRTNNSRKRGLPVL